MSRVMYKRDDNSAGFFPKADGDKILSGSGWKPLDARSIPYTSPASGRLENVSAGLDHLLQRLGELSRDIAGVLDQASRMDAENDAIAKTIQAAVHELSNQTAAAVALVDRNVHKPVAISRSSNPALQFEPIGQTLRLDVATPGSFDDSAARLGANSIQGALTRLAGLIGETRSDYYRVYNEAITLSQRLEDAERRLASVEKVGQPT